MDEIRFDSLTRSLTTAGSRRRALVATLGGTLGLLGWQGGDDTAAHNPSKGCKKKSGKAKKKCLKQAKAHNATHTVAAAPPPPNPCDVCPSGCTFKKVQAAIDAENPQLSIVRVCPGTYVGDLLITRSLTLIGAGDGDDPSTNTILQGSGTTSVVTVAGGSSTTTIENVRVTGGAGAYVGGGILNNFSTLTVTNCTVTGNRVNLNGGGIDNTSGTMTLNGCTVTNNDAANNGGGIGNSGTTTLNGCTVSGNRATNAGGIFNFDGTVTLNTSVVSGNTPNNCNPPIAGCTG